MRKRDILCALCALTIGLCMTAVLVACRGGSGEETSAGSTTGSDEPIGEFTEPEDSETVAGESVTETVAPPDSETEEPLTAEPGHAASGCQTRRYTAGSRFRCRGRWRDR